MKVPTINRLTHFETLTVTVKMSRQFGFRLAVAIILIRLAAKILGCRFEVVEVQE